MLAQDRLLKLAKGRSRLDPELVTERASPFPVHLERIGLAARPVQRRHQLCAQPLAHRELVDELAQLSAEHVVPTESEFSLASILARLGPQLLESFDVGAREGLVREVAEWSAPPKRKPCPQPIGCRADIAFVQQLPAFGGQPSETPGIDLVRADLQQ